MTFRSLAAAALVGAAVLTPSASAAVCISGPQNCPYVVLGMVLRTYDAVDERVDDLPPVTEHVGDPTDLVQQRCYYVDPSITRICILP